MALPLTVIASVSRPERIANVCENFQRQREPARLVLVLNGAARDVRAPWSHQILRCDGGTPARARNAGLEWAKANGPGIIAFWDDDDYYGPGYLTEIADALRDHPRRIVGKPVRYVEFDDGLWLFARKQDVFLGGTMAGWAAELPFIPDLPCGEDHEWCRQLQRDGFEFAPTSGAHYLYNRKGDGHAWRSTRAQMLYTYGPAFALGRDSPSVADGTLRGGAFVPRATIDDVQEDFVAALLARSVDGAGALRQLPPRELVAR